MPCSVLPLSCSASHLLVVSLGGTVFEEGLAIILVSGGCSNHSGSLQVKNNQLPAIVMCLTSLRLLGSPAVCNLWVTQTVWDSRPADLHTRGTCYWDHPFPADRLWPRWSGCSCFEREAWTRLFMVLRLDDCPPQWFLWQVSAPARQAEDSWHRATCMLMGRTSPGCSTWCCCPHLVWHCYQ